MDAPDLVVGGVARPKRVGQYPSGAQTSGDHLHAVGRFGMPDVTEVVAVDWIGDELQCALFAGWHESVADFLTLAYSFVPLRIIGSRRLYAATAFVH